MLQAFVDMSAGAKGIWIFGTLAVSGQALKWVAEYRAWKKLPVEAQQAKREGFTAQVELLTRQLAASDRENRRTRAEIRQLRLDATENERKCREEAEAAEARYRALQIQYDESRLIFRQENEQLRGQLVNLERELSGLSRRQDQASVTAAKDLRPETAPEAAAATARVERILGDPESRAPEG